MTDVNHDTRISALEENGGGSHNSRKNSEHCRLIQIYVIPLKFEL